MIGRRQVSRSAGNRTYLDLRPRPMRRTGLRMTPGLGSKNWDMGTETAQATTPTHGYEPTREGAMMRAIGS